MTEPVVCAGCGEPPLLITDFGKVYVCSLYAARDTRCTKICGYVSRYLKRRRNLADAVLAWDALQKRVARENEVGP